MAIPIQNTCRLLGEPLSIAKKIDRSHQLSVISYQLSVISYQLSVHRLLFTEKTLPISPRNAHAVVSPLPHLPTPPLPPSPQFIIHNL
ncbi:MAG: hypothetical protein O9324_23840 [Microcystis sp. LE19-84.1B]|uniref:hypothetical protein n=1 Tax=Microcystis sp. LE19-84.1B TaxID=3016438 RepID=UPI0022CCCFC4|nr:hypothetical protein [Microcystis sp. LE19-84.1B]MCZ8226888.1 hypothetical protein [Microcystis sp. LE19-84.1B]